VISGKSYGWGVAVWIRVSTQFRDSQGVRFSKMEKMVGKNRGTGIMGAWLEMGSYFPIE
jgi:hypothetical protein